MLRLTTDRRTAPIKGVTLVVAFLAALGPVLLCLCNLDCCCSAPETEQISGVSSGCCSREAADASPVLESSHPVCMDVAWSPAPAVTMPGLVLQPQVLVAEFHDVLHRIQSPLKEVFSRKPLLGFLLPGQPQPGRLFVLRL